MYYLVQNNDVIKKLSKNKKLKKIKYTKQFLKGVDGIDLDLKVNNKKSKIELINN